MSTFQYPTDPHLLIGVASPNVFVSLDGAPFGAVWDGRDLIGGRGRLALVTAHGWIRRNANANLVENLQAFLEHEPAVQLAR